MKLVPLVAQVVRQHQFPILRDSFCMPEFDAGRASALKVFSHADRERITWLQFECLTLSGILP
jgi:hypothetical protein